MIKNKVWKKTFLMSIPVMMGIGFTATPVQAEEVEQPFLSESEPTSTNVTPSGQSIAQQVVQDINAEQKNIVQEDVNNKQTAYNNAVSEQQKAQTEYNSSAQNVETTKNIYENKQKVESVAKSNMEYQQSVVTSDQNTVNNKQARVDTLNNQVTTVENQLYTATMNKLNAEDTLSLKQTALDNKKSELATINDKLKNPLKYELVTDATRQSGIGFIQSAFGANSNAYKAAILDSSIYDAQNINKYKSVTQIGDRHDAFDLDNILESINYIKECNELRKKDGMSELKISPTLMVYAMYEANYAAFEYDHNFVADINHYGTFDAQHTSFKRLQNLAAGMTNPFYYWYDEEKVNYLTNNGGKTGHYLNIISDDAGSTGYGFVRRDCLGNIYGYQYTHMQDFSTYIADEITVEAFERLFMNYYNKNRVPKLDVQVLQNKKTVLNSEINNLNTDIITLKNQIQAYTNEINKLTNQKNTLTSQLTISENELMTAKNTLSNSRYKLNSLIETYDNAVIERQTAYANYNNALIVKANAKTKLDQIKPKVASTKLALDIVQALLNKLEQNPTYISDEVVPTTYAQQSRLTALNDALQSNMAYYRCKVDTYNTDFGDMHVAYDFDWEYNGVAISEYDQKYYVYKNGIIDLSTNGVFRDNQNRKLFFKNGTVDNTFTGLAKYSDGQWYYFTKGVFTDTFTGISTSNVSKNLFAVRNGKLDWGFTGILKNHQNGKWVFTRKGVHDNKFTGVAKSVADGKWYHVKNGKLDWNFTGLSKSVSNGQWYFSRNGKVDWSFTGVAKSIADGKWYHCKNGKLDWGFTGVSKSVSNGQWYFSRNGKVDWNYTGIAKSVADSKYYYVTKGKLNWNYSGKVRFGNGYKTVRKGKVV